MKLAPLRLCRDIAILIATCVVFSGCVSSRSANKPLDPVPPDVALVHGSVVFKWASIFVGRADGVEIGKWWEPESPVTLAPGFHNLVLQFRSDPGYENGNGILSDIDVTLEAGHRYVIEQVLFKTSRGQVATSVWIEDVVTGARMCDPVVVWPLLE